MNTLEEGRLVHDHPTPARRTGRRTQAMLLGALALVGALLGLVGTAAPAEAYPGAPWFEPSKTYTQNFPDPEVLLVGDTYHAYSTATGGAYLPVMTSKDLVTWTARPKYDPGYPLNKDPYFNDALPYPAKWGGDFGGGRMTKHVWAPGVERFGNRYIAFYAVRMPPTSTHPERYCISTAAATSPLGPFVDNSPGPLLCDPDPKGSIDPEPFRDPATGKAWLIWKSEGVPGSAPTKMWSRELSGDGWTFAPGSTQREILRTSQGWEGNVIENPSMVRHNGQLYLVYSGNEWDSSHYAVGYAKCDSPAGPCRKPQNAPLIASSSTQLGPGGATAFVTPDGRLKVMHQYWNAPYTSYPSYPQCEATKTCTTQGQRRMKVVELRQGGSGLEVGAMTPPKPTPPVKTTEEACPAGKVPAGVFNDVTTGTAHGAAIECAAWWGVAAGSNGKYNPGGTVTRAQMASFLARTILQSGGTLPAGKDAFSDDEKSVHQGAINSLAAAGIVQGDGTGKYRPDAAVTREQMASFLTRTVQYRTGKALSSSTDWFWDDEGSSHETSINAVAGGGLAGGTGGGAYSPAGSVRRDQMASFLTRTLETFVEAGARLPG